MIRVRFAPSPTGTLHVGGARTALFNYLFAKKNKGEFVLRIEDTDIERSNLKWEKEIIDSLKWLGLEWDEGPRPNFAKQNLGGQAASKDKGKFGPYRQSERIPIYEKYLKKLLEEDKAYYCFCTEEELEAQRQDQLSRGFPPRYAGKCAALSREEREKLKKEGKSSVIRFRTPPKIVVISDLIRGKIEFDTSLIGDIVIAKDIKTPLYNFSCTVDDFEMKISHIIRGEEHISNTPKQILIQEALGFSRPEYVHIALTLGPDKSKLSKRHGAVSMNEYRKQGYLPEALINFMALLGWNPGTEQEIFSMKELIEQFSLDKMTKSGAIFNIEKLDWINGYYIRKKSLEELTELCVPYLAEVGLVAEEKSKVKSQKSKIQLKSQNYKIVETGEVLTFKQLYDIVRLFQERLKKLSEIGELSAFFFKEKLDYDRELLRWKDMTDKEIKESLKKLEKIISKINKKVFKKDVLEKILMEEGNGVGDRGKIFWPLRVALSGKKASPGPCEIAEVLGKEKTLKRVKDAKHIFEKK